MILHPHHIKESQLLVINHPGLELLGRRFPGQWFCVAPEINDGGAAR